MTGPSTDKPSRSADEIHMTTSFFSRRVAPLRRLVEPLLKDMGAAWRRGECPSVEDYLERHPELKDNADAVLRLVCEEICLREETGAKSASTTFCNGSALARRGAIPP